MLFSDESRFNLSQSDRQVRIWKAPSTRFQDHNIVEVEPFGGGSVMVWGGISADTKTLSLALLNRGAGYTSRAHFPEQYGFNISAR